MPQRREGHALAPRRPARFRPATFPVPTGPQLVAALAREHARAPFTPRDVRDAARRVAHVASRLELEATVIRGGLDVGGAELDHVWVAINHRVVDVVFPLHSDTFVAELRAYIAGDLEDDDLDRLAHAYAMDWRVIGDFPDRLRYFGLPVWSDRS
ncbi:MAG: hypothetical protein KY469_11675 [Actinobacteria bacterium]|nr:hypothetical protein [Actinomycetota bacterium]